MNTKSSYLTREANKITGEGIDPRLVDKRAYGSNLVPCAATDGGGAGSKGSLPGVYPDAPPQNSARFLVRTPRAGGGSSTPDTPKSRPQLTTSTKPKRVLTEEQRERRNAYQRAWCENNRERVREKTRKWNKKNREKQAECLRAWRKNNPDRVKSTAAAWREKNREKLALRQREWVKKNKDKARASTRAYRDKNPEKVSEKNRRWRKNNPEKARFNWATHKFKRRSLMKNAVCDFTAAQWREIQERQHHKCAACGAQEPLTIDHIVAVTKGGAHTASNIQGLCMSCNKRKNNKEVDYRKDEHKWTAAEILGL